MAAGGAVLPFPGAPISAVSCVSGSSTLLEKSDCIISLLRQLDKKENLGNVVLAKPMCVVCAYIDQNMVN